MGPVAIITQNPTQMAMVVLKCYAEHTMHRSLRLKQLPVHKPVAKRRQQHQKLRSSRGVS
jgi:hypothetical protein